MGNWRCSSGFEDIDDMWIEAIRAASHGEGGDILNILSLFVAFFWCVARVMSSSIWVTAGSELV